jgi:hypothetical protein
VSRVIFSLIVVMFKKEDQLVTDLETSIRVQSLMVFE